MTDPVPPMARIELGRLAGRWHQLPLGQALPHVAAVRELAQRYADRSSEEAGRPSQPLPDLGPAVAMDQLAVTVYDLCRDAHRTEPPGGTSGTSGTSGVVPERQPRRPPLGVVPALADELAEQLADLRRRLD